MLTVAGQPLGTLQQEFVDRLVEEASCFLLGGRAWVVSRLDHTERQVRVEPAPRGRQPTWGGYLPQFLGFELCQRILRVLCGAEEYAYLHSTAAAALAERREAFGGIVAAGVGGVEVHASEIRWWTFAGGRINTTLRHALSALHSSWTAAVDNFGLKIRLPLRAPAA